MATLHCVRNDDGQIEIKASAALNSITAAVMSQTAKQLGSLRPRPITSGCERDGDEGKTTCCVTIHGHTSDDGVFQAIKAIRRTLAPLMPIDMIDVSRLSH